MLMIQCTVMKYKNTQGTRPFCRGEKIFMNGFMKFAKKSFLPRN